MTSHMTPYDACHNPTSHYMYVPHMISRHGVMLAITLSHSARFYDCGHWVCAVRIRVHFLVQLAFLMG
jgi:hypothetical protein